MKSYYYTLIVAVLLSCVLISCDPDAGSKPEKLLPRGVGGLLLNEPLDTTRKNIEILSDKDNFYSISLEDFSNPVLVKTDDNGNIVQISWSQYVVRPEKYERIKRQAQQKFGHFLISENEDDNALIQVYKDDQTSYRMEYRNKEIVVTVSINKSTGSKS